jgi:hypothetical protein
MYTPELYFPCKIMYYSSDEYWELLSPTLCCSPKYVGISSVEEEEGTRARVSYLIQSSASWGQGNWQQFKSTHISESWDSDEKIKEISGAQHLPLKHILKLC